LKDEAERLFSQARALRADLPLEPEPTSTTTDTASPAAATRRSPWTLPPQQPDDPDGVAYRLDIDIGRESGTWMDPRWGASGRRMEFTVDVCFLAAVVAAPEIQKLAVQDNILGAKRSSAVYTLQTAENARLRNGFERMKCHGGGYRIDTDGKKNTVVRFFIQVDGTMAETATYGDVSIPPGCLYFSLPIFGGSLSQLSSKEGPVTVRQIGWHTGWRREESRIVGTFRVKPMQDAQRRDKF
jgi:hypothetical protein